MLDGGLKQLWRRHQFASGELSLAPDLGVVRGRADGLINTGGEKVVACEVAVVPPRHLVVRDVACSRRF
ncbi:hypothetical protein Arub01_05970 [Actinomadura rubrobrunea]|uniref:Uncharacterized protein n=1 Tax=Actinomadura rubrobrunea TaxID=115335 RepID=A0A9W6PSQ0_9ACTN|nr:hypothetical protein [Actinomadura rubrobrunea]GLW62353.1 hypothetical protein Arub01_05970 [Actinomadura rubrobrunea]